MEGWVRLCAHVGVLRGASPDAFPRGPWEREEQLHSPVNRWVKVLVSAALLLGVTSLSLAGEPSESPCIRTSSGIPCNAPPTKQVGSTSEEKTSIAVQKENLRQLEEQLKIHRDEQREIRKDIQEISKIGSDLGTDYSERATFYINTILGILAFAGALAGFLSFFGYKSFRDIRDEANRACKSIQDKEEEIRNAVESANEAVEKATDASSKAKKALEEATDASSKANEALKRTKESQAAAKNIVDGLKEVPGSVSNILIPEPSSLVPIWPEPVPWLELGLFPENSELQADAAQIRNFWGLLANSLSLSKAEKNRVWDAFSGISRKQFDELIKVFESERKEFIDLLPEKKATILRLSGKMAVEWLLLLDEKRSGGNLLEALLKDDLNASLAEQNRDPDFVISACKAVFTECPHQAENAMEWALRFCGTADQDKLLTRFVELATLLKDKAHGLAVWGNLDARMSKNAFMHKQYASWAKAHNELALAENQYQQAIALGPEDYSSPVMLADLLREQDRYEEEKIVISQAMARFPRNEEVTCAYAVFCDQHADDLTFTEKLYRQVLAINPSNFVALSNLAGLLFSVGRKEEGMELMEKAEGQPKTSPEQLLELWFYRYAHLHEQSALQELSKLVAKDVYSVDWDLSRNVKRAVEDDHPDPAFVQSLADLITKKTPMPSEMQEKLNAAKDLSNG